MQKAQLLVKVAVLLEALGDADMEIMQMALAIVWPRLSNLQFTALESSVTERALRENLL